MRFQRTTKRWIKIFVLVFCCGLVGLSANGQQRKDFERKRKQLVREISATSKLLKKTAKDKKVTYAQFIALKSQINKREELVGTLQKEIDFTTASIIRSSDVIESLQSDVERLRTEYGKMARRAYHLKKTKNDLLFLLSADSFNESVKRWFYLRQYERHRKKQLRLILGTQQALLGKIGGLERKNKEKETLRQNEESQKLILEHELRIKDELLKSLKKDEGRFRKVLKKQKKNRERLNKAIEEEIANDYNKNRSRNRKPRTAANSKVLPTTPDASRLSSTFRKNRGKLPWPVDKGIVSKYFGKQAHPLLKTLKIDNKGIDIQTSPSSNVKAIFGGKVISAKMMRGGKYMVLLKHGTYYTVYSNLRSVSVRKDQQVSARDVLGIVSTDSVTNQSEVHLEVWKGKRKLNPIKWIKRG